MVAGVLVVYWWWKERGRGSGSLQFRRAEAAAMATEGGQESFSSSGERLGRGGGVRRGG